MHIFSFDLSPFSLGDLAYIHLRTVPFSLGLCPAQLPCLEVLQAKPVLRAVSTAPPAARSRVTSSTQPVVARASTTRIAAPLKLVTRTPVELLGTPSVSAAPTASPTATKKAEKTCLRRLLLPLHRLPLLPPPPPPCSFKRRPVFDSAVGPLRLVVCGVSK